MELLKDDQMIDLLEVVHDSLFIVFKSYADKNLIMSKTAFKKYAEEFGLCPDVLPEDKVMYLFNTLSKFFVPPQGVQVREPSIDEHLFVEILALNGLEMKF
jgi:hypothetical protein